MCPVTGISRRPPAQYSNEADIPFKRVPRLGRWNFCADSRDSAVVQSQRYGARYPISDRVDIHARMTGRVRPFRHAPSDVKARAFRINSVEMCEHNTFVIPQVSALDK
jgi:hypothetical protein